ncbi:MAG: hypothetical protein SGI72_15805 [Planctomycetota bacterium]|nr:hypothetical protein [Planctomycetota bacterium]
MIASLLSVRAVAQDSTSDRIATDVPPFAVKPVLTHDHVRYDEPGDGALWALGAEYKASFGVDGATIFPAFGSSAPKNYPHMLSPDRVTVGGEAITFVKTAMAEREGDRVVMQRGTFTERYDLALDSMEQSFVFESLPRAGDLVLNIPVASELVGSETQDGLEFASNFGTLTYSRAIAIDAQGRRFDAPTRLVDGAIQIEVAAEDLAVARFPLVIDPVIGTIYANLDTTDLRNTDSAFDSFNNVWLVTWSHAYSATDNDVYGRVYTSSGTFVDSVIDFTNFSWNVPRCANLASAHQFLVVAATVSNNATAIQGRTLLTNGSINTVGFQFDISGPDAGAKTNPDVGGNSVTNGTSNYCVVWERLDIAKQIACRVVSSTSVPSGSNAKYLTTAVNWNWELPTVSKSSNGTEWLTAFTFNDPITRADTWAARIATSGAVLSPAFLVTSGLGWETQPSASSFQTGTSRAMIAYKYRTTATGSNDIWVSVLDGATILSGTNISALESQGFQSRNQIDPSIDCDGQHFVLAYSEYDPTFLTYDVFANDIALSGNSVQLTQTHIAVQPYGLSEYRSQVTAARTTNGSASHRYCISWDFRENDTDYDVIFKTFDALEGGNGWFFCLGDGTGTACPCGNIGSPLHGCANSAAAVGALLQLSSGVASTVNDTAVLGVTSVPSGSTCLFFQGTTLGAGSAFGDGLLCATGTITRLAVKFAPSGSAFFPGVGDPSLSTAGAIPLNGGARSYQAWYRDAVTYCTSATNNLSNGFYLNWAR